jgi:hypothetical protein
MSQVKLTVGLPVLIMSSQDSVTYNMACCVACQLLLAWCSAAQ